MGLGENSEEESKMVRNKEIMVKGSVVKIDYYKVSKNEVVRISEKEKKKYRVKEDMEMDEKSEKKKWMEVDDGKMEGKFKSKKESYDMYEEIKEKMIVEI